MKKSNLIILFFIFYSVAFLQNKGTLRETYDQEAITIYQYDSKEAIQFAKKIQRADRNYYLGYLFEGRYIFFKANDKQGYQNSANVLNKALKLIEKDYKKYLKKKYDLSTYNEMNDAIYKIQSDYSLMIEFLLNAYQNIGYPDSAMMVVDKLKSMRFLFDYYDSPYIYQFWLTYKNRTFTNEKYYFLGESLEKNIKIAQRCFDSAAYKINKLKNEPNINFNFLELKQNSIYFYKSLLFCYLNQLDSAEYYFKLQNNDYFSNNNYGIMKLADGKFKEGEDYFNKEIVKRKAIPTFHVPEPEIWLSQIYIYKGVPSNSVSILKSKISEMGSRPGYGWLNLALGRAYFYAGDLNKASQFTQKGMRFDEIHFGTSWNKEQYDFLSSVIGLMIIDKLIAKVKFQDVGYWKSFTQLKDLAFIYTRKYSTLFLLTDRYANNVERDKIFYRIFNTENVVVFDEFGEFIKYFGKNFYISKLTEELNKETRPKIKKYYKYFLGKLYIEKKNYTQAIDLLKQVLNDRELDSEYEKLLIARIYESLALAYDKSGNKWESNNYLLKLYQIYPQIIPYSDLTMTFNLRINGNPDSDKEFSKIIDELKNCKINFVNGNKNFPTVELQFEKGKENLIYYRVFDKDGKEIVKFNKQTVFKNYENGKDLALNIFNINLND